MSATATATATPPAPTGTTTPPSAGPRPWRWTREQYFRAAELGYFGDRRVQLTACRRSPRRARPFR